jgi:hypothetical protein
MSTAGIKKVEWGAFEKFFVQFFKQWVAMLCIPLHFRTYALVVDKVTRSALISCCHGMEVSVRKICNILF